MISFYNAPPTVPAPWATPNGREVREDGDLTKHAGCAQNWILG
jgi:hypothetical protein